MRVLKKCVTHWNSEESVNGHTPLPFPRGKTQKSAKSRGGGVIRKSGRRKKEREKGEKKKKNEKKKRRAERREGRKA